ncbi:putative abhydrolase domain-containing protein [Abeliophyllum distichum]|uniref:Abhydrolase domain-containing protein n=1 Tax=Abeliophyllum distichum TaxID=126358 RepID=A0ABD1SWJ0_9LAMI
MDGVRWPGVCTYGLGIHLARKCLCMCFQTVYQPGKLLKKTGKDEEPDWFYFCPWGAHKPLVMNCPSYIKKWKESWFWVTGNWQRVVDDPELELDVTYVYGITSE